MLSIRGQPRHQTQQCSFLGDGATSLRRGVVQQQTSTHLAAMCTARPRERVRVVGVKALAGELGRSSARG
eukprot:654453-Pelagomonas_calceolata.AAC.1